MIEQLEHLKELIFHPYVVALISFLIGCYLLRDIARIVFYIYDGSRRADQHLKNREKDREFTDLKLQSRRSRTAATNPLDRPGPPPAG